jgi:hypothetical protein
MGQILSFPKKEAKRFMLSLSLLSLAVAALVLGERLNDQVRPAYILAGSPEKLQQINRAIASAQPYDLVEDIQWENDLAKRLSHLERAPAAVGHSPSQLDELRFGPLAGKYRISEESARISQIDYVDSPDVSDRPVFLRNRESFLKDYRELMSVGFAKVEFNERHAQSTYQIENYNLLDGNGKVMGSAAFQLDEIGRFLSLKVQARAL